MDAIVMLKEDHKRVEQLFKKLEKGELAVVPEICEALTLHAELEEMLFYPEVREEVEDSAAEVAEAVEEHHVVKLLISELRGLDEANEAYKAKATVLMELVRHHVEEEEGEMFPEVRSTLGRKRLQEIGEQMASMKEATAA